ncbi:VOC family protein [Membranihabitans maritimus]|uniref:VOC family protein n=1 Tax=Membranihabitans maritimus TaxID=2904244 RepID=UPI001F1A6A6F|nr:VOC family protein [Membranihabitans maritimus]
MKLNAGIITKQLEITKEFYTKNLNFGVTFENDFYLLLHTPNKKSELAFLLPNHPSQHPIFHKPFNGEGIFLTIELENVDEFYKKIKEKNVKIIVELRDEPWGDRHFAIRDPNGLSIDFVTYTPPQE